MPNTTARARLAEQRQRRSEHDNISGTHHYMPTEPLLACKSVIALIDDYLDDALSEESSRQIQLHLSLCAKCRAYTDSYAHTVKLARSTAEPDETETHVPDGLSEQIVAALKRRS